MVRAGHFETASAAFIASLMFVCLSGLVSPQAAALGDVRWDSVKTTSGTLRNTTVRVKVNNKNRNKKGNNNKKDQYEYRVRPQYVGFRVTSAGMRIRFETKAAGERPDMKMELQMQITRPNGDKDWQRVGVIGRTRGDGEGENAFASGPGNYRIELTGKNTKYTLRIDQPVK